jgi:hypothetical protein
VLILAYIFTHILAWLITAFVAVVVVAIILRLLRRSMSGSWFPGSQTPQQPYSPYQQPQPPEQPYAPYQQPQPSEQPYSPYQQGYSPTQENYAEPAQPGQYPPQSQPGSGAQYEEPTVQYPQELPPMEQ